MDSRIETWKHIENVIRYMNILSKEIKHRGEIHDASKLKSPEVELLDQYTEQLKDLKYLSPEYEECRQKIKPALDHHYENNRHHPEYWEDGIKDMSLVDLLEMVADWMAAAERTKDGDVRRSIEMNQKRFGYTDETKQILLNTVNDLEELSGSEP